MFLNEDKVKEGLRLYLQETKNLRSELPSRMSLGAVNNLVKGFKDMIDMGNSLITYTPYSRNNQDKPQYKYLANPKTATFLKRACMQIRADTDKSVAKTRWYVTTLWAIGFFGSPESGSPLSLGFFDYRSRYVNKMRDLEDIALNPDLKPMSDSLETKFSSMLIRFIKNSKEDDFVVKDSDI